MKYTLTKDLESIVNKTSSHGNNWYHEVNRKSKTLLICAGDSWTWGDSLDPDTRTQQIYGALISQDLNCDFINIGLPGESNLIVKDYLSKVKNALRKKYKKIHVIFTLTESTRDLVSVCDYCENTYNFIKGNSWTPFDKLESNNYNLLEKEFPDSHILDTIRLHLALSNCNTIESTLQIIEDLTVSAIKDIFPNTIFGRNFTSWSTLSHATAKLTWTEVIAIKGKLSSPPVELYFATHDMGAKRIIDYNKKFNRIPDFKENILVHLERTTELIDWLVDSPHNSNKGSKHPLEDAHKWWADYLQTYIQ